MSDIKLFQTNDDGEVTFQNGDLIQSTGIETAVYLSLFGGNIDDGGHDYITKEYWADLTENDSAYKYRSETQHILANNVLTTAELRRIEQAVKRDLQWLIDTNTAKSILAEASSPVIDKLKLDIFIDELKLEYVETLTNG